VQDLGLAATSNKLGLGAGPGLAQCGLALLHGAARLVDVTQPRCVTVKFLDGLAGVGEQNCGRGMFRGTQRGRSFTRRARSIAVSACAAGLLLGAVAAGTATASASSREKKPVSNWARYVGGHGKANGKLSPITIGLVNQQTATAAPASTWTTGTKAAVEYVNQHTGGIDGHPLKTVLCKIPTTVGAAAKCGQEFADNGSISAVAAGAIDVGNTALESALKASKKPMFFGVSISPSDGKYPYGFILAGDTTHIEAPFATAVKTLLHAKSVSMVYPSTQPGEVSAANIIYSALEYDKIRPIYKVGFTSSVANLTEPFEAAHVGSTTVFILVNSGGPACSNTYLTLKSLGLANTKVIVNEPCDTPTVAKADGGQLPHDWYYLTAVPLAGSATPAVTAMKKVMLEYHTTHAVWGEGAFAQIITIAKLETEVLKAGKHVSPATVLAAARQFRGPVAWGSPRLDCGGFPGDPAVCNDLVRFFQNTRPNVMKAIGPWVGPPKGFKLPVTGH